MEGFVLGWGERGQRGPVQEPLLHNGFFHNNNHLMPGADAESARLAVKRRAEREPRLPSQ